MVTISSRGSFDAMTRKHDSDTPTAGTGPTKTARFDFAEILAIADALPTALAFIDRDLHYRFVNQALADFLEVPRRRLLWRNNTQLLISTRRFQLAKVGAPCPAKILAPSQSLIPLRGLATARSK